MKASSRVVVAGAFAAIAIAGAKVSNAAAIAEESAGQAVPGLVMPSMDAVRGKQLFASKGCVVCHSINGVGGADAPRLDAATMPLPMNPFEFFARMWRGAVPMVIMQMNELVTRSSSPARSSRTLSPSHTTRRCRRLSRPPTFLPPSGR